MAVEIVLARNDLRVGEVGDGPHCLGREHLLPSFDLQRVGMRRNDTYNVAERQGAPSVQGTVFSPKSA
jgi:hypothetical protein